MAAAVSRTHRVKVAVVEQRRERRLPTSRAAVNPDPGFNVQRGIFSGGGTQPTDSVWEASVSHVLPTHVVEGL
jgi:hypothetical protein